MAEKFFRRITNPNDLRRKVLESSKEIIQNLKSYQKILKIREEKTGKIKELKRKIKEINLLFDKLRDSFPAELLASFEAEKKKTKSSRKGKKKTKNTKKEIKNKIIKPSELTKLENKLSDIENKLKTL